jgi:hypothetical protein
MKAMTTRTRTRQAPAPAAPARGMKAPPAHAPAGGGHDFGRVDVSPAAAQRVARDGRAGVPGPLPHRAALERSLNADLGGVRAFRGPRADAATRALDASAYAHRGDVVLGAGADLATVGEEAAHALQQRIPGAGGGGGLTRPGSPAETEAAAAGQAAARGAPAAVATPLAPAAVARNGDKKKKNRQEKAQERGMNQGRLQRQFGQQMGIVNNTSPHGTGGTGGGQGASNAHQNRNGKVVRKLEQQVQRELDRKGKGNLGRAAGGRTGKKVVQPPSEHEDVKNKVFRKRPPKDDDDPFMGGNPNRVPVK